MKTASKPKSALVDVKRAIFSSRFVLSVLGAVFLYLVSAYDHGLSQAIRWGTKRHLLDYLGDAQTVALMNLLPFAAVVPFGAGFAEDWEFHAHHYFLTRTSSLRYRLGKLFAAVFSGGLALLLAMLMFLLIVRPFATLNPSAVSTNFEYMNNVVKSGQWGWYFGFQLALTFLYGAIWASASALISTFTAARSLIYCCPVLFENVLLRICRLIGIPGLYGVSFGMVELADPLQAFLFCAGILLVPTLVLGLLFMALSGRKLRDA